MPRHTAVPAQGRSAVDETHLTMNGGHKRQFIRLALGVNPMTGSLQTLIASATKEGRGLFDIEMYAMWAHSKLIVRSVCGDLSRFKKQVLLSPFRDLCARGGINSTSAMDSVGIDTHPRMCTCPITKVSLPINTNGTDLLFMCYL